MSGATLVAAAMALEVILTRESLAFDMLSSTMAALTESRLGELLTTHACARTALLHVACDAGRLLGEQS